MNAVAKIEVMDWSKFTAEEWFKQYGAYIQTCRMKSGNEPDSLGINQIYWLICENNKGVIARKDQIICKINDFEAEQVRKLIVDVKQSKLICDSAKVAVQLFIEKNVRGMSLRQMATEFKLGKTSLDNMIFAGKYFLNGHDKRLLII
ncbi:hypothetical protein [Acinetobacter sp. WCHAc060007]|jgi:hypothetical protein|uniref:hypothetical protein n=1 Tax=Acinetobacter sp. WCHAc060007 TaxID=2419605 RepID=UPI000EA09241|nr:hypothetical protein [Acinetobacter sp. WCHAc060007]RKG37100.1 hypothetical protein D7V31_16980 [Acinetobacter sp. WCHAc060007]